MSRSECGSAREDRPEGLLEGGEPEPGLWPVAWSFDPNSEDL